MEKRCFIAVTERKAGVLYWHSRLSPEITFAVNGSTQTMESMANGIEGLMTGKAVSEVRITSDIPVKGTLTVDGGEGSSYAFDTFSTEFTQKLELSEGIHVLEFRCVNQEQELEGL